TNDRTAPGDRQTRLHAARLISRQVSQFVVRDAGRRLKSAVRPTRFRPNSRVRPAAHAHQPR
ncbi:MAG TPA: hypothetical protein VIV12_03905, partial [Streptosporangiaceae bacterium]